MATGAVSSSIAAQAQLSLSQSREDHLLAQMGSRFTRNDDAKIEKGAKEFESILLGSWLQQAEQSMATVPGADDGDEDAAGRDQMMSLGVESLATSLTASGGIGISAMIAKAIHAAADKAGEPAATEGKNEKH